MTTALGKLEPQESGKGKKSKAIGPVSTFLGSSNLLFLCVGLTGIMLLVNNNLVRAFAIISAIALIRFRVNMNQKNLTSSLLFAVMAGMACGVKEIQLAWTFIGVYVILITSVWAISRIMVAFNKPKSPKSPKKGKKSELVQTPLETADSLPVFVTPDSNPNAPVQNQ